MQNTNPDEMFSAKCDESVKTGLIYTSNYTHLKSHNFPCESANDTKYASLIYQSELCTFKVIILDVQVGPIYASSVTNMATDMFILICDHFGECPKKLLHLSEHLLIMLPVCDVLKPLHFGSFSIIIIIIMY